MPVSLNRITPAGASASPMTAKEMPDARENLCVLPEKYCVSTSVILLLWMKNRTVML